MPVQNLTLYDLLVHTIPGLLLLVLISPILIVLSIIGFRISIPALAEMNIDGLIVIGILVLVYSSGHLLQKLSENTYLSRIYNKRVLHYRESWEERKLRDPFQITLTRYNNGEVTNYNNIDLTKPRYFIQYKFLQESEDFYGIKVIDDSGTLRNAALNELYWLVQSYLFNNGMNRAERWQHLEDFYKGIWIAHVFSSIINFSVLILGLVILFTSEIGNTIEWVQLFVLLFVIIVFSLYSSVIAYRQRERFSVYWGRSLWTDFYVQMKSKQ